MSEDSDRDDGERRPPTDEVTREIGDDRPSEAVIQAVAVYRDEDPLSLDPLYDAVDPDHLDGVFGASASSTTAVESLRLRYEGCAVTVTQDSVAVEPIGDAEE